MNMFTNLLWEAPWFILKEHFFTGEIGAGDLWAYPWWAYGVADTRYLTQNDLIVAVTSMDAAAALMELCVIFLCLKGYRAFACVMGSLIATCMLWGQYYFFVSEIYNNFRSVGDGQFGFFIKFWGLSLWWLFIPAFAVMGFMWEFAVIQQKKGIEKYISKKTDDIGQKFSDTGFLVQTDENGNELPDQQDTALAKKMIALAFILPLMLLAVDMYFYFK